MNLKKLILMKLILQFCTSIALASSLHAATWTVDNVTSRPADFRTIQAAIDVATVGDTLLISPSASTYSGFTLTKRLNIKGTGASSFLPMGQGRVNIIGGVGLIPITNTTDPNFGRNAGGSLLEGLNFSSVGINSACSGVTLKRITFSNNSFSGDSIGGNNAVIVNSWFARITVTGSNVTLIGNYFTEKISSSGSNVLFENCNIGFNLGASNPIFFENIKPQIRNSIVISSSEVIDGTNDQAIFDHCLAIGYKNLPSGSGNISVAANAFSTVFVGISGAVGYRLKAGSPAIGAGRNGVDMGIWGGSSPFVEDLVPSLPRVTSLNLPAVVPDSVGLTFEVSAEARE